MHEPSSSRTASVSEWHAFKAAHPDIKAIDAFVVDSNGQLAGKRLEAEGAEMLYRGGVQFSASALVADCRGLGHDAGGLGKSDGDPDGTAMPMSGALVRVPWTSTPTAQVLCRMLDVKRFEEHFFDPRVILQNVVDRCRAAGVNPVVACELEFYLIDPRRAPDGRISVGTPPGRSAPRRAGNLSLEAVEENATFLNAVNAAALEQGLPVCGCVAEYGIGQYEVNLRHQADPVVAADQAVLLKRLIKGVARSLGMDATFMAKPFMSQPGNGLHVHASIVDEAGGNRFGAEGGDALLRNAIAGMQGLLYDSFGLFAPNFNAQRRYWGLFVPTSRDWAHNNRSVAFRIPHSDARGRRIEHRVAGADASPHLVVAAILAGLLDGIVHKRVATEPVDGRASNGGDDEFPGDLVVALDRLEHSARLAEYIPAEFLKIFCATKRGEYMELIEEIFPQEYDFYA
jgi:glutamine synthetase